MNLTKKNVLICDNQPVAVEGIRSLLENTEDLHFAGSVHSLEAIYGLLRASPPPLEGSPVPEVEMLDSDLTNLMGAVAGDANRPDPNASVIPFPAELAGMQFDVAVV